MKVLQTNGLKAFMASIRDKFISKSDTVEVETLGIDNIPTKNSNNLVKSSGVYSELATKLTEPSSDLAVGKYFRIASIDSAGHAVLECIDIDIPIKKISAGGYSNIIKPNSNGIVNIPGARMESFGIVRGQNPESLYGIRILPSGYVHLATEDATSISASRENLDYQGFAIRKGTIDEYVKLCMCDGRGTAWTDAERLAALLRMGCTVDENGFVKWTATPSE